MTLRDDHTKHFKKATNGNPKPGRRKPTVRSESLSGTTRTCFKAQNMPASPGIARPLDLSS